MRALAMPTARRLGLLLLLVTCAPLIMAAGGGPGPCAILGTKFRDLDGDRAPLMAGEPGLDNRKIRVYPASIFGSQVTTRADGSYELEVICGVAGLDPPGGEYTVCEVLEPGWLQTFPSVAGGDVVSCAGIEPDPAIVLAPLGYRKTVTNGEGGTPISAGNDFGNINGADPTPPVGFLQGKKFNDLNRNGIQDAGESGLADWLVLVFRATDTGIVPHAHALTASDGSYRFILEPGIYRVCEQARSGWAQTGPLVAPPSSGLTLADCTGDTDDGATKGYDLTIVAGANLDGADFGNASSGIRGVKFNDLNGNGVRDPDEPGIPGWEIHLVRNVSFAQRPQPGPPVHAIIKVDRHTRRPPGGERRDTCSIPGCTTTTGGRVSIVLTQGPLRAEAVFTASSPGPGNAPIEFQLGCVPGLTPDQELNGAFVPEFFGFYQNISNYALPNFLPSLFARIGIVVNPPAARPATAALTYFPVITQITKRECVKDPNPANNAGVTNPGILVVEAEIGFVSEEFQSEVVATATTNAAGEYDFMLGPGPYIVCESLSTGWRQTFPGAGQGRVKCVGANSDLGPHGYMLTLVDPGEVVDGVDFGNAAFSGLTALRDAQLWFGLKSSDDQGTQFDVKVELLRNGSLVASGLRRCVTGLTSNPTLAQGIRVAWDDLNPVPLAATDILALKVSTRIGTNPDDTKCAPERGASHTSARGLRLYYDAASRPSHFDAILTSDSNQARYLDSNGTACPAGGGESRSVTDRILTGAAPIAAAAKCRDSSAITSSGGNPFKEVGIWTLR